MGGGLPAEQAVSRAAGAAPERDTGPLRGGVFLSPGAGLLEIVWSLFRNCFENLQSIVESDFL